MLIFIDFFVYMEGLDVSKLEAYLSDTEFVKIMGDTRENFYKMPAWKQTNKKKQVGLF